MLKNKKGITLISLVITIIILIILAGVMINLAIGGDGLLSRAGETKNEWNNSVATEQNVIQGILNYLENQDIENKEDDDDEDKSENLAKISAGYYLDVFLDNEGSIWNFTDKVEELQKIESQGIIFKEIDVGDDFAVLLDETGNIWTLEFDETGEELVLEKIEGIETTFKAITAGVDYSMAIDETGNIWTWGGNASGQLGDGTTEEKVVPQKLEELETTFKFIDAEDECSMAIDEAGNIWTWGSNYSGKLGDGTTVDKSVPQKLEGLETSFKVVNAGSGGHAMAIDEAGNIWSWGQNNYGQLGDGTTEDKLVPQKLENLGMTFKEIGISASSSIALDENGHIWTWGSKANGQLGDGTTEDKLVPQKLENLETTFNCIDVDNNEFIALSVNNEIYYSKNATSTWNRGYAEVFSIGKNYVEAFKIDYSFYFVDAEGQIWCEDVIVDEATLEGKTRIYSESLTDSGYVADNIGFTKLGTECHAMIKILEESWNSALAYYYVIDTAGNVWYCKQYN